MSASFRCLFLIVAVVFVTAPVQAAANDWPEFRGPTFDGISPATDVPVEWSTTKNVVWKQEIPGSGWSSPVLVDGRIYLTTAVRSDAGDVSLRALCVDAADGHILWNQEIFQPLSSDVAQLHNKNSLASPTPIVRDGRLYVHFGHMGTAALDLDGNIIWRQTDIKYASMHGNGGSPALVDDLLIFSCDGPEEQFIVALDSATGEVRWRQPRNTSADHPFSFSTPQAIQVDGHTQLISPGSGLVGGYDLQDGREIWRVEYGDGHSVIPRPVFKHGLIYTSTGFIRANLLAIDPKGASGNVTNSHVRWQFDRGVPFTPSLLVIGDEIYFVSDQGVATCLDAHTGKLHWTERLGGSFSASPILAEGRIYFLNEEGTTYVIRADTEYELLATNELEERSLASPAVTDGAIFLRTASHLWRIGHPMSHD